MEDLYISSNTIKSIDCSYSNGINYNTITTATPTLGNTISWNINAGVTGGIAMQKGDRVVIKEGYDGAGTIYIYIGKSMYNAGEVTLKSKTGKTWVMEAAVAQKPYTAHEIAMKYAKKHKLNKRARKELEELIIKK